MTYYSVVRYMPNPLREECINVGLIAAGENETVCYFPTNLKRAAMFGGVETSYLREVIQDLRHACDRVANPPLVTEGSFILDEGTLRRLSSEWSRVILLSEPKPSSLTPKGAIAQLAPLLIESEIAVADRARTMLTANKVAVEALQTVVQSEAATGHELKVVRSIPVSGTAEDQKISYGLRNEVLRLGGEGISFEIEDQSSLRDDVTRIAYKISDIRSKEANGQLPLAVLMLGNGHEHKAQATRLRGICKKLDVSLVKEGDLANWAYDQLQKPGRIGRTKGRRVGPRERISVALPKR